MPTTNGNKRILDLPRWEIVSNGLLANANGSSMAVEKGGRQQIFYILNATTAYSIDCAGGGTVQLPNPTLGTLSVGGTCCVKNVGPSGTCSSNGTSTTIVTSEDLQRGLNGYKIHITGGPAAGDVRVIKSNTTGANATITVDSAFSASPTTSTTYRIMTPRLFALGTSSSAASAFRRYCWARDVWENAGPNALPASFTNDAKLVPINSFEYGDFTSFATGTATAGTANTISNSAKSWTTNQWTNHQVRITGGTGAGQIRTISSNTGTQITVSANWTTNPDATSLYSIEGNDEHIYLTGNASTAFYRFTVSSGAWTTMTARGNSAGSGLSAHWVNEVSDADWTDESNYLNGKYIYSIRGGSSGVLERYDIQAGTWSTVTYAYNEESPNGAWNYAYEGSSIYMLSPSTGASNFQYDVVTNNKNAFVNVPIGGSGTNNGDRAFVVQYVDGATKIKYLYFNPTSLTLLLRLMLIP